MTRIVVVGDLMTDTVAHAALPLARAGIAVAGIEAGGWMDPRQFRPDEIYNNIRGLVTSVPKAAREIPTLRFGEGQPTRYFAFTTRGNAGFRCMNMLYSDQALRFAISFGCSDG